MNNSRKFKIMRHPIEEQNRQQAKFLEGMDTKERSFHARLFRIGNASYCYYQRTKGDIEPTHQYFEEWLTGLPENIKSDLKTKSFESCKTHIPFLRYVMERNDIGMDEWMGNHLSEADYNWWQSQK